MGKTKFRTNKKAIGLLLFPTMAFMAGLVLFLMFKVPDIGDYIGSKQSAVLRAVGQGEEQLAFVDTAAKMAALQSIMDLGESGGFYADVGDDSNGLMEEYPCDRFGYNLWNDKATQCWPGADNLKKAYQSYFEKNLKNDYFSQHPEKTFSRVNYAYQTDFSSASGIIIRGITQDSIPLAIVSQKQVVKREISSSDKILDKEPTTKCCDGQCVESIAERYYSKYGPSSSIKLFYVWGGATPYSIQETIKDLEKKGKESFFDGANISTIQPEGNTMRSGQLTTTGFDCSGFVWWVYKHAELSDFYNRKGAGEYEQYAREKNYKLICDFKSTQCTKEIMASDAQPGDLVFLYTEQKTSVGHVAVYAGNSQIIDSSGDKNGIDKRPLPDSWYERMSVFRFPYNTGCTSTPVQATAPVANAQPITNPELKLGALSEKYESDKEGSNAIGYDTTGKTSYGKFQISSSTMPSFLKFVSSRNPALYASLSAAEKPNCEYACEPKGCWLSSNMETACTPNLCYKNCKFAQVWREEVQRGSFNNDIERDFIKRNFYDPALNSVRDLCKGLDINERSFALQNVLWSTAVQHGGSLSTGLIFQRAGASPDKTDAEIIKAVYAERSKVGKYFSSSTAPVQESVRKRFIDEEATALNWLSGNVQGISELTYSDVEYFTPEQIGYYYVNPSFSAQVDYDLSVYEQINRWSRQVYDTCSGNQKALRECVEAEKEKQNDAYVALQAARESAPGATATPPFEEPVFNFFINKTSVCDGKEAGFYNFIETFETCFEFGKPSCRCDFSAADIRFIKGLVISNTSIMLKRDDGTTYYYPLPKNKPFNLYHDGELQDSFSISYSDALLTEPYQITYTKGSQSTTEGKEKFYLVKDVKTNQDGQASVIIEAEPTQYVVGGPDSSFPSDKCDLANQQHKFRFCVTAPKKIYQYDTDFSRMNWKEVPIKFALDLFKAPPPPITADNVAIDKTDDARQQEATADKQCEGLGNAEFDLKVTTENLEPAFGGWITDALGMLAPQLKVLLFAQNFLMDKDSVPAMVTVKLDLKGASKDCDIVGLVYKCGTGVQPFVSGKFDFSNPTGYIDLSQRFKSGVGFSAPAPTSCISGFNNPDGTLMQNPLPYARPQIDGDIVSFSVVKCAEPIFQFKRMPGLDIISSAFSGFGYYFAFAYVDSSGNYGPATIKGVQIPAIIDKLMEQLGFANTGLLQGLFGLDSNAILGSFGLEGFADELSSIRKAIGSLSLDRMLTNLKGEALSTALGEVANVIKDEDAMEVFNTIVKDGRINDADAASLLQPVKDELQDTDATNLIGKLESTDLSSAYNYIQELPFEQKKELLSQVYDSPEEIADMGQKEVDERLGMAMQEKEDAVKVLQSLNPEQRVAAVKTLMDQAPSKILQAANDIIPDEYKVSSIKSIMSTATGELTGSQSELTRMIAYYSPDYVKKQVMTTITDTVPGFDQYKDVLNLVSGLPGQSCGTS